MGTKRTNTNIAVDVEYFKQLFTNSGMTQAQFAATIGRTASYINNIITRGYIQKAAAILLCKQHGGEFELLCPPEHAKEAETEPKQPKSNEEAFLETLIRIETKLDKLLEQLL